jgi:ribosome-associated heat shock protein Hsp15
MLIFTPMEVRLDTYLWAIRIYKSRTLASSAIKAGKVKWNNETVKPARIAAVGDTYTITLGGIKKIIEAVSLIDKRGSYEKVKDCYVDHTPPAEKSEKLESMFFKMNVKQEKGSGRPTKKHRRDLGKEGGWF